MQRVLEKKSDGFYGVLEINVTFVVNFKAYKNRFGNKALDVDVDVYDGILPNAVLNSFFLNMAPTGFWKWALQLFNKFIYLFASDRILSYRST